MVKSDIEKRLAEIEEILTKDENCDVDALQTEIQELRAEKKEIEKREARQVLAELIKDGKTTANPVQKAEKKEEDIYATVEYRKAFMQFCKTGVLAQEYREDAYNATTDVSAVIPSTIMDEVIKKMSTYGNLFSRVRKLNVKGGVNFPISSLKPTASWITEATPSSRKKLALNTKVSFNYYGLECKIATSLLAETVTLNSFETTITDAMTEANLKSLDVAIIAGDGTGEPLGITQDTRVPAAQIVTLSSSEFADWGAWKKKVFGKIPVAYRAGGSFIMAAETFEGYIDGMQDANGQPMARVNYGIADAPQERFGGREVILVEDDVVEPYSSASTGEVVAVFCNLKDYAINSNMQMTMYRWLDHDTNQWVDKSILIADGKLLDPNGVVIVKKGA